MSLTTSFASFTTPAPASDINTTASSTATNTTSNNNGGTGNQTQQNGLGGSSTLYLYTFLATLVLLLGISSAIVVRSLIVRRRQVRMVEEAIRNGTWIPNPEMGPRRRGRRPLGEKPKLWDVYLRPIVDDKVDFGAKGKDKQQEAYGFEEDEALQKSWNDLMPVSVQYLNADGTAATANGTQADAPLHSRQLSRPILGFLLPNTFAQPFRDPQVPTPEPPAPIAQQPAPQTEESATTDLQVPTMRVTFLISMPTPPDSSQASRAPDDEVPPPIVEFGVIDTPVLSPAPITIDTDRETVE